MTTPGHPARWIAVASLSREEEARLLAGRLRSEGIAARVFPEFQGGYYGHSVNMPVQVLVPEHRIVQARTVIEAMERG